RLGVGSSGERIADGTVFYRRGGLRARVAARFEVGELDDTTHDAYEYTRSDYYGDRRLWGGLVDHPNLGGRLHSAHQAAAVDARLSLDALELGLYYDEFTSGYGVQYAADRVQNDAAWKRRALSVHARHRARYAGWLRGQTLLQYRQGGIPSDSYYVDG